MRKTAAALCVAMMLAPYSAKAEYPQKAITLVVPFAAGGTNDTLSRIIGEHLSKTLGATVLIENDPGAAGTIAARRVSRAAADGYTLIMGNMGTHAVAVSQYRNLNYDPLADFTPVGMVAAVPAVVVAKRSFPGATLADLRAAMRERPGRLSEAHVGVGSPTHTFCTLLHSLMGTEAVRIGYRGGAQAINDLVGGHVDFSCISLSGAIPQITAGSIKALAVANSHRVESIPDVPTAAESGLPGFEVSTWNGIFAPANLPAHIRDRLAYAVSTALDDQSIRQRLTELGFVLPSSAERGPSALRSVVEREIPRWTQVLRESGTIGN